MLHEIKPYEDQKMNVPMDPNDPAGAEKAIEIRFPSTFSEKARKVVDYLKDTAFLYLYKGQFVLTDESLQLTNVIQGDPHAVKGGPRWTGDSLEALEQWLEVTADLYDESGKVPGWNTGISITPDCLIEAKPTSKIWRVYEKIDGHYAESYFLRTKAEAEFKMRCFIRKYLNGIPLDCMYGEDTLRASSTPAYDTFSANLMEVNWDADVKSLKLPDFYQLHPLSLMDACEEAKSAGFTTIYDPTMMIHTSLSEYAEQLSPYSEVADRMYVRFGNAIVCLEEAWEKEADVYKLE